MKKALKKSQPDEENAIPQEDGTDTEPHDSLPHDKDQKEVENPQEKTIETESYIITEQKTKSIKTKITKRRDLNQKEEMRRSSTKSTSSKDLHQDSLSSNWSENIPVITISKTESSECILEQQTEVPVTRKERKMVHQERVEENKQEDSVQVAEPQCPVTGSSETLVRIKMEEKDYEINLEIGGKDRDDFDSVEKEIKETAKVLEKQPRITVDLEKGVDLQKSGSDSTQGSQNKTESSGDYQE